MAAIEIACFSLAALKDPNLIGQNAISSMISGGRDRIRTGTSLAEVQILSLLCLPFHHAA
jgi:hypothetical protein